VDVYLFLISYFVFAFLIRSPYNAKLFVVAEEHSALKQSLDQLNLFSEDNPPSAAPVRMPLKCPCDKKNNFLFFLRF